MLYNILISYLRILSQPRHENYELVPDGSYILDCLAYGFSKLIEDIKQGDDIHLSNDVIELLEELDARIDQVANSSKHWNSTQEWELVHLFTWKVIEALGLDRESEIPVKEG